MNKSNNSLYRRSFLTVVAGGFGIYKLMGATGKISRNVKTVHIVEFDAFGNRTRAEEVNKVVKSDDEWRRQLSPAQFEIARKEGTEPAGTGRYAYTHTDGLYHCVCCDTVLFDSKTKFESGTGWPSFYQPIAKENVVELPDQTEGAQRTKVQCVRCDAHLGHVFDDGPKPTGLRYCMDSASLNFVARGNKKSKAY
jgi:peptide-methionine (R)-S-oxide reductase